MEPSEFKIPQEVINQIPPIPLDVMDKELVNVYTLDKFTYNKKDLPCIILLLPDDITPSGHYIALCQSTDQKVLYYFDSFGYDPLKLWEEHPQMMGEKQDIDKWGEFLKQYEKVIYQDKKLQSDNSCICGYYCLAYIYNYLSSSKVFTPETFATILIDLTKKYNYDSYDNTALYYYFVGDVSMKVICEELKKRMNK